MNNKYALAQDGQKSAEIKMAKPHAHVMMTQMSIKQGIMAFGECGSDAMLKELNQLHEMSKRHYCCSERNICPMNREKRHYDT